MANQDQEKLLELLRRAATLIGETLITDEFDAETTAAFKALHDDLMAVVRRPAVPTCTKTWFVAGGRDERTCGEIAEPDAICAECGAARCAEHTDISFEALEKLDGLRLRKPPGFLVPAADVRLWQLRRTYEKARSATQGVGSMQRGHRGAEAERRTRCGVAADDQRDGREDVGGKH